MADNVVLNQGFGGDTVATDEVNGLHYQKIKLVVGADDAVPTVVSGNVRFPVEQQKRAITPSEALLKRLKHNASGSTTMSVSGSTNSPIRFLYTVPAGKTASLNAVIFHMRDTSIQFNEFLGTGAALTNGITVKFLDTDDSVLFDALDGEPIQTTGDFSLLGGSDVTTRGATVGTDEDLTVIEWNLLGDGYEIQLLASQSLEIAVQDDLSSVAHMKASAKGRIYA